MTISNLFLSATIFVLFFVMQGDARGTYLEHAQIPLYGIILTEIFLILGNKVFKNQFLDILNLIFIAFFLLRVPFIYGDDVISDVYLRNVDIDRVSYALYVLNFNLIALSACVLFLMPARTYFETYDISNDVFNRVLKFTSLILVSNIFYIAFAFKLGENNLPSAVAIFLALFNWGSILILLVPLLVLGGKKIAVKYRIYLYFQLLTCVFLVMYTGSKSGLFQIFALYLISFIVIRGATCRISMWTLLRALMFIVAAIAMYILGDIFNKIQRSQVEASDLFNLLIASLDKLSVVLNSVSYRIGYLDFYIDKLTQEVYASAFQLKYYVMSFLDAVSPGFDFFGDVPLVSRAVYNNYFGISIGPNSEVSTVFAEAHQLFGYLSIVAYLFVLSVILFVRKYMKSFTTNYGKVIIRIFIVYMFYNYMIGIGIDYWLFGHVIYPFIFITLSFRFIEMSLIKSAKHYDTPPTS
jgi:hypothetical protein